MKTPTSSNLILEPSYDANRLLTDYAYRFEMVDQFTAYMNNIELYGDRVIYFITMCKALNLNLASRTYDSYQIPNRPFRNYDGYIYTDDSGNEVSILFKCWNEPLYTNDEERAIKHRIYFSIYYRYCQHFFLGVHLKTLSNLKAYYFDKIVHHANPESFKQSELETVQRKIDSYQEKIDEWAKVKNSIDKALRKQFEKASQLVEDEINGSESISWELFIRTDYLKPIALLWDIVAFKLFLIEQINNSKPISQQTDSLQGPTKKISKSPSLSQLERVSFENYVEERHRLKLMPFLINTYKEQKAQKFGLMIYALHTLDIIPHPKDIGDNNLYEAIKITFGVEWDRQALNYNINLLNNADKNKEIKIKNHSIIIKEYMNTPE